MSIHTIDTHYADQSGAAAAFLMIEGDEAAFVETNTANAVPHLLAALAEIGLTPEAVRYIIITHIHLDHAGGAGLLLEHCPNATLLAHPRAARHAIDPTKLERSARGVYGDAAFDEMYGTLTPVPAERVRTLDDGETLVWGRRTLTFLHTRGHANHHFVIHDSRENAVFTGDAFGIACPITQANGPWIYPSTSPTDFDGPAAIASVHRIVETGADTAYLTHFGPLTGLADAARQLIPELEWSTAIVAEADESGVEAEALGAWMAERVTQRFEDALVARDLQGNDAVRKLIAVDVDLNAQGLAFAVTKRRYKRANA